MCRRKDYYTLNKRSLINEKYPTNWSGTKNYFLFFLGILGITDILGVIGVIGVTSSEASV